MRESDRKLVKTINAEYYEIDRVMMFVGKACRNENRQYQQQLDRLAMNYIKYGD